MAIHCAHKKWTSKEIKFLEENYNNLGYQACAEYLNRTLDSVRYKCSNLNLKYKNSWSLDEDKYLRDNYRKTCQELSNKLDRSISAIRVRRQKLRLINNTKLSDKQIEEIRQNNHLTSLELSKKYKVSQRYIQKIKARHRRNKSKEENRLKRQQIFQNQAKFIHTNKYKYFDDYENGICPVNILCKIHGIFSQRPSQHLLGSQCSDCMIELQTLSQNGFELKANHVHNNKYSYGKYKRLRDRIEIFCKICNKNFNQFAGNHVYNASGCTYCKISKGEKKIQIWLEENNILFKLHYFIKIKGRTREFDFYLYQYNIAIEYNGEQHYKPIQFSNSQDAIKNLNSNKRRDEEKRKYCQKNHITLIEIPYWEFDNIETILTQKLNNESSSTL